MFEQHVNIKVYIQLGKSSSATTERRRATHDEAAMKESVVFEWQKRLKEGREDVKNDGRPGRRKNSSYMRKHENVEI